MENPEKKTGGAGERETGSRCLLLDGVAARSLSIPAGAKLVDRFEVVKLECPMAQRRELLEPMWEAGWVSCMTSGPKRVKAGMALDPDTYVCHLRRRLSTDAAELDPATRERYGDFLNRPFSRAPQEGA